MRRCFNVEGLGLGGSPPHLTTHVGSSCLKDLFLLEEHLRAPSPLRKVEENSWRTASSNSGLWDLGLSRVWGVFFCVLTTGLWYLG